ncbi:MAG: ABC transporter ATP-binding protein [Limisphaerales bacterium]
MNAPVVELRAITKEYPGAVTTRVLTEVDLAVAPGEFVAVVGASGSGKTTLLNLVGLLDTPTSGQLWLAGRDVARLDETERARLRRDDLGFIFQFHYLLPEFSVLENALMPCRILGEAAEDAARDRVRQLLQQVGLGDRLHFRPHQLSGGQQQRAAIVRALANDPALVLADEPTGNLDSKNGRAVFEMMRFLNQATGKAFLMVTHDEHFAAEADRVIHLVDGRVADTRPGTGEYPVKG